MGAVIPFPAHRVRRSPSDNLRLMWRLSILVDFVGVVARACAKGNRCAS